MNKLNVLALCCLSTFAAADTTLTFSNSKNKGSMKMMIADNMMRANQLGDNDGSMIYNANTQTFTILMDKEKEYMIFGPKEIEALSDVRSMMMKQIDAQLAQMPESQRAMMKDMMMKTMASQMPKAKSPPSYKKSGESSEVNGFDCDIVIKTSDNGKSEFCVTPYSELGMSSGEYGVIESFQKTVFKLASQFGDDASMDFSSLGDYVPVKYSHKYDSGTLQNVSHESIPESAFKVPDGYKKKELPLQL